MSSSAAWDLLELPKAGRLFYGLFDLLNREQPSVVNESLAALVSLYSQRQQLMAVVDTLVLTPDADAVARQTATVASLLSELPSAPLERCRVVIDTLTRSVYPHATDVIEQEAVPVAGVSDGAHAEFAHLIDKVAQTLLRRAAVEFAVVTVVRQLVDTGVLAPTASAVARDAGLAVLASALRFLRVLVFGNVCSGVAVWNALALVLPALYTALAALLVEAAALDATTNRLELS